MKKKILSIVLACCMSFTTMTPVVYAEENTDVTAEKQENESNETQENEILEEVIQEEQTEDEDTITASDEQENNEANLETELDKLEDLENVEIQEEERIQVCSGGMSLAQLRNKFPAGKYWNHAGNPGSGSAQNNQDGYTSTPCPKHGNVGSSSQTCNGFAPGGTQLSWQCMGYAEKLGYDATGYNPRNNSNGWSTSTSSSALNNLKAGDIVRYKNNGHSIYVTAVNGDTVTYTDCNSDGHCIIRWDQQISKSTLKSTFTHVRSAPSSPVSDTCNCSTAYAGNYTCTTSSQNLTIRSGHGSSYSKVGSIPSGATVYVSKASGTGAGDWAHVEYNGVSGFASMEYLQKQDTGHDPFGVLDSATGGIHSVTIRGWALDEDDYGTTLGIHAYIDDTCIGTTVADKYRPDVNNVYSCGDYHGYEATFSVDSSIVGERTVRIYAINTGGGSVNSMIGSATVNIEKDTEAPVISDCQVTERTSSGYTVSCTVTDNSEIDRVQFPTWTKENGQDDIASEWPTNPAVKGTKNGDTYSFRVNIEDHNNEMGTYITHIYAYDHDGNYSAARLDEIEIVKVPDVVTNLKDDFYAKIQNAAVGTVLTRTDEKENKDVCFSEDENSRKQIWHFVKNAGSDSYTVSCEDDEAMVLDVEAGTDNERNNVQVWSRNGSKAQQWEVLDNNGTYCLKPLSSAVKVLDTPGGNVGTQNAQIYSYNEGQGVGMNIIEVSPINVELKKESLVSSGNYNQHRYEVFDQGMTWSDAKRVCEELGGHLVTITSEEEQNFVTSLIEEGKMNQYWLGLQRYSQEYAWITGESVEYSNWDKGEPNGIENNKEYCAEILNKANPAVSGSQRFKWNDVNNSNTVSGETDFFNTDLVGFICEYDSIKNYTLTYDANGGTNAPEKKTDEQDAILKVSEDTPIRRGYKFLGWSTEKDAEKAEYQANDEIKLTKDITLYAVWEKMEATGTCGEKVSWELDQQGVLTVYGEGAMKNYTYKSEMPWHKYLSKIQKVVIEKGVTTIGDYAFYGMTDTTEITIPEGVKTIGEYAFKNSTKIAEVKLPSTLKKLGQSAFYGCTSLSKIAIPEGLYTIWGYTFKNCTSLAEVTLPSTLIKIDEAAFYGCSSLKKIEIPEDVSIIGIYCFKNCSNLSEISLPESMTKIREAAFYGTAITEITIPDSVTAIGSYAFKNCAKLKKVNLSKELKTIEESAFYACESMTKLILPSNVTTIGDYAFRRCVGLQVVEFSDSLKKIGESAFYGCSDLSELVLPEGMTEIGGYAFKSCTNVTSVSLPSTLNVIGESGFYGCDRIESIEIPAGLNAIGDYAFSRCTGLNTVTFKGDAPSIADYTFAKVKATVYYPGDNETWTQDKLKNYGGTLTWKKN